MKDKRIVIIDDSSLMCQLLSGMLDEAGYGQTLTFTSLTAGWEYLSKRDVQVNLILMDKVLPDGDGIEAIARIRETPHLTDTPVIMVTGFDDRQTLRAAFDAGATDFINKSFDETELQTRVRSALRLDEAIRAFKTREADLRELTRNLEFANRKLERQSLTDGLTGVANRRRFDQALERAWEEAFHTGSPLSVALLDVDHFKRYNDHFGHQEGDDCLRAIAAVLDNAVRFGSGRASDLVARYGGEEFAVILLTDAQQAAFIAERLRLAVEDLGKPHPLSSIADVVTVSVGVASVRPDQGGSSLAALCSAADAALYAAKDTGRNRVIVRDGL